MAGTTKGGLKAAAKNKELYGSEFYARIGAIGGKKTGMKGFALNRERARLAGQKGGRISRRGKSVRTEA
jgi:general stress protein YciG